MKKLITFLLFSFCIISISLSQNTCDIDPELQHILNQKSDELISVNILFKSQIDISKLNSRGQTFNDKDNKRDIVLKEFKKFSESNQSEVLSILKTETRSNNVKDIRCHWITNIINCKASRDVIFGLAEHPDIAAISYDKREYMLFDEEIREATSVRCMTNNITKIKANEAWNKGYTGKGIIVSVLDTGINTDHVDLKNNLWDGGSEYPNHGYNTLDYSHDITDRQGHGTHCAGTICGDGTSGKQTGMAPDATLMCIKVLGDNGEGSVDAIIGGVEFSIENGADVLSLSLGVSFPDSYTSAYLRYTFENLLYFDVLAVVAAGNDRDKLYEYPIPRNVNAPGNCPPPWIHPDQQANTGGTSSVLCVGAVNYYDYSAYFSSEGPVTWTETYWDDYKYNTSSSNNNQFGLIRPDVSAPGVDIVSCSHTSNNGFATMSGTSMATPCVAGAVALLLEKYPDLTPARICEALETSAVKLTDKKSNKTGSGRIDIIAAMDFLDNAEDDNTDDDDTDDDDTIPSNLIAPTLTAKAISTNEIELSWNAIEGATYYTVYLEGNPLGTIEDNSATVTITLPVPGYEYCFTATASNEYEESEHSNIACDRLPEEELSIPEAPTLTAKEIDKTTIKLSWNTIASASSYNIYKDNKLITNTTTNYYNVKDLTTETEYCFTVTASNQAGESNHSNIVCMTIEKVPCIAPKNLVAEAIDAYSISLTWKSQSCANGYKIYRDGFFLKNVDDNEFIDEDLDPEIEYCYTIKSICDDELSKKSEEVCVTTPSNENITDIISSFNIYPNPVEDRLVISTNETIRNIRIYNIIGITVYSNEGNINSIDMTNFNNGVYFINIKTDKEEITKQFIKK